MKSRAVRRIVFVVAIAVVGLSAAAVQACPMCNQSIANEDSLPRAYMYSILFMLGMPATLFSGFGIFLFYKFRAYNAAQAAFATGVMSPSEAGAPHSATLVGSA